MDLFFPILVLWCGLFIQLALQQKDAKVWIEKHHPVPNSYKRMDLSSWLFIIVGALWSGQLLIQG
jgi:hypothetical protein